MSIAVQPANIAHCAVLSRLHAGCFATAWAEGEFARMLAMPGAFALLARQCSAMGVMNPEPMGFALARAVGGEGEIITLGVLAVDRGRGVGGRLVAAIAAEAAERGARTLFLEVAENNISAMKLYQSSGFISVGRREGYYRDRDGGKVDAVIMQCETANY